MRILSEKGIRKDGQHKMIGNNDLSVVIAAQSWVLLDIDKAGLQEVLQVIWSTLSPLASALAVNTN